MTTFWVSEKQKSRSVSLYIAIASLYLRINNLHLLFWENSQQELWDINSQLQENYRIVSFWEKKNTIVSLYIAIPSLYLRINNLQLQFWEKKLWPFLDIIPCWE